MLYNMFIWFLDQENIGLDPQIMILHEVISEIFEISDFEAAILKNIANMIPEGSLNKMVPLIAHGLYAILNLNLVSTSAAGKFQVQSRRHACMIISLLHVPEQYSHKGKLDEKTTLNSFWTHNVFKKGFPQKVFT